MKQFTKSKNISLIWIVAGVAILLFYFFIDPGKSSFVPQCVFHKITGLQCMGCGAQRMLHALLHGNIKGALEANAFLFFSMPGILFLLGLEIGRKRFPVVYQKIHSGATMIIVASLLAAWFIIRNFFNI